MKEVEMGESKSENEIASKPYESSERSKDDSELSVDSDPDSNEDQDPNRPQKKPTFSEEGKDTFKMPESRMGRVLFFIFFPIHVCAFYCIPNIRNKPNLSKVKIFYKR